MDISQITENWPVSHGVYVVRDISISHTIGAIHTYQVMFLIPVISQCKLKNVIVVSKPKPGRTELYDGSVSVFKHKTHKKHVLNFLTVLASFFSLPFSNNLIFKQSWKKRNKKEDLSILLFYPQSIYLKQSSKRQNQGRELRSESGKHISPTTTLVLLTR